MTPDVVVVGGGSAGCVLAARLSEHPARQVVLIEAGPDYPSRAALPPDIADGWTVAASHDWGFATDPDNQGRTIALLRGRLVGGCSAVNAGFAVRGCPADYDAWAEAGNPGWSFVDALPSFVRAEHDLDFPDAPYHGDAGPTPIRRYPEAERTGLAHAFLAAAVAAGHAPVDDHNRPGACGVGPAPTNIVDGLRMSAAVTYLAAARGRENLAVRADTLVDRVVIDDRGTATGVELADGTFVEAGAVVLAAGALATPAILLRSGVGPADQLRALEIEVVADLPGVGRNLVDHPFLSLDLPTTEPARSEPKFQTLTTWQSSLGASVGGPYDMHVLASGPWDAGPDTSVASIAFAVMKPRSRGWLRLRSRDPHDPPRVHPGYLEHPDDTTRMVEGLREARRVARTEPLASVVAGPELGPAPGIDDDTGLAQALRAGCGTYQHAAGTCRMGPSPHSGAVVDARGRVHGIDGLLIGDASVMPDIPAANTNLPTMMVAEQIAAWLGAS